MPPPQNRNRSRSRRESHEPKEFDQRTIEIARVTRVVAGGKRMRFRAIVALGDGKGRLGVGLAKGADVSLAVGKAAAAARKHLIVVPIVEGTLPRPVRVKFKAALVLLKPARPGTGVIAGGAVRTLLELAGVKNVVAKMLGSESKVNNVYAVLRGLATLSTREVHRARLHPPAA
jgi:small subunit ribosomal protein S5